jgi:hypothetical protein
MAVAQGAVRSSARGSTVDLSNGEFRGVSCLSISWCMAVGSTVAVSRVGQPVVASWNGSTWSVTQLPLAPGQTGWFNSVSCASSTRCMAVGGTSTEADLSKSQPLVERWDGTRWGIRKVSVDPADPSELFSVSCPIGTDCEAVGRHQGVSENVLLERWNGTRWQGQSLTGTAPGPSPWLGLQGISCPTTRSCFAAGAGLVGHWNGRHWSVWPKASRRVSADAVSCFSSTSCTAVGNELGKISHWNGKRWRIQGSVDEDQDLYGVSCPASRSCLAVGRFAVDSDESEPQAGQWNGSRWTFSEIPVGSGQDWIDSVSCPAKTACVAVGGAGAIAGQWNGTSWTDISP